MGIRVHHRKSRIHVKYHRDPDEQFFYNGVERFSVRSDLVHGRYAILMGHKHVVVSVIRPSLQCAPTSYYKVPSMLPM